MPTSLSYILAVVAVVFTSASAAHAQQPAPTAKIPVSGSHDARLEPFDKLMLRFLREHRVPGAAVAITRDGRLIYARGFGYADLEHMQAMTPYSLFRIASISKPITAVAILKLVEQGKLKLDDNPFAILQLSSRGGKRDPRLAKITIRQMLQHTAGWDRGKSFDPMFRPIVIARDFDSAPPAGPTQIIRYMMSQPLDFDPGARYAYSNFGYCILGRVIEKVSGQDYETYVRKHILAPVGDRRTRVGKTLTRQKDEVRYYDQKRRTGKAVFASLSNKEVPLPYGTFYLEAMDSHGGWISSAVDLVRFASAFDDPENSPLLQAKSIRTMFARPAGSAGRDESGKPRAAYYGLGWNVRPVGTRANTWHMGSLPGTATLLVRRYDGLNWAVLFNTSTSPQGEYLGSIIDRDMHQAAAQVKQWPTGSKLRP